MSVAVSSGGGGYDDGPKSTSSSSTRTSRRSSSSSSSSVVLNVETIRLHASSMVARIVSRVSVDTLRPLPMFVGVVTPQQQQQTHGSNKLCFAGGAYTPPVRKFDKTSLEKVKSRVALNGAFFLTNYVLVAAMVGLVVALMHPGMLFFVGICYGLWTFHAFLIRNELELFGIRVHSLLSIQQRFYLNFAITTVVVLWKCLKPALIFVILSSLLIFAHAFLRDPKHIEAMDAAASAANSSGEGSALSPSGSTVMLRRGVENNSNNNNGHGSDDDYYEDEEANMGSSSAGSSGSEKGAVLVDRPGGSGGGGGSSSSSGMTKRRGEVI